MSLFLTPEHYYSIRYQKIFLPIRFCFTVSSMLSDADNNLTDYAMDKIIVLDSAIGISRGKHFTNRIQGGYTLRPLSSQRRKHAFSFFANISLLLLLVCGKTAANQFDPYQLNGGLVAAVAGKDYVLVVATDTRLVGHSGYDILESRHLRSRLWSVQSPSSWSQGELSFEKENTVSQSPLLFEADGSLQFPESKTSTIHAASVPSTLIASSGCQADCEMLKHTIRSEMRRLQHWGEIPRHTSPTSMAVLLSQTLYARRTFPWYAFCIVAGLASEKHGVNNYSDHAGGQGFVYDAIGSYEAVAVATAGNGRNLLQPILDRSFSSFLDSATIMSDDTATCYDQGGIVVASYPRVQETAEQAAAILIKAYRAVSERDASVGDFVVLCCIQREVSKDGKAVTKCWSKSSPLKKH